MRRRWIKNGNIYILKFRPFVDEEEYARIIHVDNAFMYQLLQADVSLDYLEANNIEDSKREVETIIRGVLKEESDFHNDILTKFDEK